MNPAEPLLATRRGRLRAFREAAEPLILDGANRGIGEIRTPASFSLHRLADSLESSAAPSIAILTGFPILIGDDAVEFENDGPIGAGMLAGAFAALGWPVTMISDVKAGAIIDGVVTATGAGGAETLLLERSVTAGSAYGRAVTAKLTARGVTHLLAIERPGRARDGEYYNMRAQPIGRHIIATDDLVIGRPWQTAAFADGGNEIGMGRVGIARIAKHIDEGATIVSRTPVDFLTLCGVSNWGAYGLLAALVAADPALRKPLFPFLSVQMNGQLFEACKVAGAVDGVTRRQTNSIDNLPLSVHNAKVRAFRALAERLTA